MATREIAFFIFLVLALSGCLKEDPLNQPFIGISPVDIGDGHQLSTPAAEQVDANALAEVFSSLYHQENLWPLRSMLVFRNGKLIGETYLKDPDDITNRHIIWSCTKQVIGALSGIALTEGVFEDLNDPMGKYFDTELTNHQEKKDITLRNLLTMQSGIDYNNDGKEGETDQLLRQIPDNSVDFILARPINAAQGTEFHYNDGNPHLMSALIQKITGKPTDIWADEVLFSKIEMTNYNWVRYKDGISLGGFGIETTPREMAKFALIVADSGRWKGNQVIDSNWISEMTMAQADTDFDYDFGYMWWIDPSRGIYFMWGVGGQFAFVVPSRNLVVVMTSFPNTSGDYQILADEALPIVDQIISACY